MKFLLLAIILMAFSAYGSGTMRVSGDIMRMDGRLQIIEGRFRGEQEGYVLTADRAVMDEEKGMVTATSNVRVVHETYILTSGTLVIYIDEDRAIASDGPRVVERVPEGAMRQSIIEAREIESFQAENRVIARGNVVLTQKSLVTTTPDVSESGLNGLAPAARVVPAPESGKDQEDAAGEKKDAGGDPRLYSDFMEMFMDEGRSVARGNVRITDDEMTAYGERAVYFDRDAKLILVGGAWAEQKSGNRTNTVTGDKIIYFLDTERIIITSAIAEVFPSAEETEKK